MRLTVVIVLLVLTGLGIYFMAHAGDSKPLVSAPSSVIADAISTDLDIRTKADISLRVQAQNRDFKQLLAMGTIDDESAKGTLDRYEELKVDVAKARSDLINTGSSAKALDSWLAHLHWDEVQALAEQIRNKMKQSDQ